MDDNSIQEGTKVVLLINGQTYQFCTVGKEKYSNTFFVYHIFEFLLD